MRHRRAFSLVELLTALVLLSVGLAAFTRAAGGVARLENDARLQRALADVVQARLDSLTAAPCAPSRAGQAHHGGVTEHWRAVGDGSRWLLTDSITVPARPKLARTYAAALTCWR